MIEFVTVCKNMQKVIQQVEKAANTDLNILITGEKGVGKAACARLIHSSSNRAALPYAEVRAERIKHKDLQYQKAFFREQIKKADNGTLYVDEVPEFSPELQQMLLKASEEKDFRLIASTTASLEIKVQEGDFLRELYHLLCVVKLRLPSLRERKGDLSHLIKGFVDKFSNETGEKKHLSEDALADLCARTWHGNIYELESSLMYAFQRSQSELITKEDLPVWAKNSYYTSDTGESLNDELYRVTKELLASAEDISTYEVFELYKRLVFPPMLKATLEFSKNNKSKAAMLLGINRNTLKRMIQDYYFE